MTYLPPNLMRPARLSEVQSPGILLKVGKYGAPFLVVGSATEEVAIFLGEDHRFQCFPLSKAQNWEGVAVEELEFELDPDAAVDLGEHRRWPGMMIRRDKTLNIAVVPGGPFSRGAVEVVVKTDLPPASEHAAIGFSKWRAFVRVDDDRVTVWECSVELPSE